MRQRVIGLMRIRPAAVVLAITLSVIACGSPSPQTPVPSTAPPSAEILLPAAGELYLVTYVDQPPAFGIRVDAIGPSGRTRPIARLDDIRPAGWENAQRSSGFDGLIGPTGLLALAVERNGGFEPADVAMLLIDV